MQHLSHHIKIQSTPESHLVGGGPQYFIFLATRKKYIIKKTQGRRKGAFHIFYISLAYNYSRWENNGTVAQTTSNAAGEDQRQRHVGTHHARRHTRIDIDGSLR